MFEGIRYSPALGEAAGSAFPNFYPYRFAADEPDPTGMGKASIPYLLTTETDTHVRIKGNGASPWHVTGTAGTGYRLEHDGRAGQGRAIRFEPRPAWLDGRTSDGTPMAQSGLSLHGDMLVINIAPGCEYFVADKQDGRSMRCTFCAYGAPDERSAALGQIIGETALPEVSYRRMQETLQAVLAENTVRHIYLVGGSLCDWHEEGLRYLELARRVQAIVDGRVPVTCGSGALPRDCLAELHAEGLVEHVCFNLEVWSQRLFSQVCPGKERFVGYEQWIGSLEAAVDLWGNGNVYSAMVAGVELEPETGLDWEQAADLAIEGAEDLGRRGIIPIYSLYWPLPGRDHAERLADLRAYFERLNLAYREIRENLDLRIADTFMCHRCAYMQLECDIDRALGGESSHG